MTAPAAGVAVDVSGLRGDEPALVAHDIEPTGLWSPSALAALAGRVPPSWHVVLDGAGADLARPLSGLLTDPDAPCFTGRLAHLELLPGYREVGQAVVDAASGGRPWRSGVRRWTGVVFAGSEGSSVPPHVDRHHNLLLQLEGSKEVTVGRFRDPARHQREVERDFWPGRPRPTDVPDDHQTFVLTPGLGVYVPPYAFHWVTNITPRSTALSVAMATAETERAELVHRVNRYLRRVGLHPSGPGRGQLRDRAKAATIGSLDRVAQARRSRESRQA